MEPEVMVRMNIDVPHSLRVWLRQEAKANGVNMSAYIRQFLLHQRKQKESLSRNKGNPPTAQHQEAPCPTA